MDQITKQVDQNDPIITNQIVTSEPVTIGHVLKAIETLREWLEADFHYEDELYVEPFFIKAFLENGPIHLDKTFGWHKLKPGVESYCFCVGLCTDTTSQQQLQLLYEFADEAMTGLTGALTIIELENYNVLYQRSADQNPRTEWENNALAQELVNEFGNYIFNGEPIQV